MIAYFGFLGFFVLGVAFGCELRPWIDALVRERQEARFFARLEESYERRPYDREEYADDPRGAA